MKPDDFKKALNSILSKDRDAAYKAIEDLPGKWGGFIEDISEYAGYPGVTPVKPLTGDQWFTLVQKTNSPRLLKDPKVMNKIPAEKQKLLKSSTEPYPTVARLQKPLEKYPALSKLLGR